MKRILGSVAALMICVVMAVTMLPLTSHAQEERKTVRVGWYESAFNAMDQFGRRSGYAYEYQRKIAAYTGWDYEYVEGSWPELLQMLNRLPWICSPPARNIILTPSSWI